MACSDTKHTSINGWNASHHGDKRKEDISDDLVKLRLGSNGQSEKGSQRSRRPESCSADDIRLTSKEEKPVLQKRFDISARYGVIYLIKYGHIVLVFSHYSIPHRRTRSLNAPSPFQHFGPCGRIMKNSAMVMTIQDPASQQLTWNKSPLSVLVVKKVHDALVIPPFLQLVEWLANYKNMVVFVEAKVIQDSLLTSNSSFKKLSNKLKTFDELKDDLTDRIDFIICLGGDGTLLYASSLFQQSVPPVMAFHLGSLGFLAPFEFENFEQQVTQVLEGHAALTLRSRLSCSMTNKDVSVNSEKVENILVLNEVVIDRGPSPYLSNIDLYLDGKLITSVQGDGLIISTPTGSTAYAVAAGASMIHPSVPAIMVTPICPHSLSFRPIVVPAGVELKISVCPDSRNTAWVSFDGRNRQELKHGSNLNVTTSIYPVPSICSQDQISDWFASLAECLHWNVRKKQRQFDEMSDISSAPSIEGLATREDFHEA